MEEIVDMTATIRYHTIYMEDNMLKKEKMDRINHLARKSKETGLTHEEKAEQEQLRKEYIEKFREHFKGHLKRIKFVEDLSEEELAEIKKQNNRQN